MSLVEKWLSAFSMRMNRLKAIEGQSVIDRRDRVKAPACGPDVHRNVQCLPAGTAPDQLFNPVKELGVQGSRIGNGTSAIFWMRASSAGWRNGLSCISPSNPKGNPSLPGRVLLRGLRAF